MNESLGDVKPIVQTGCTQNQENRCVMDETVSTIVDLSLKQELAPVAAATKSTKHVGKVASTDPAQGVIDNYHSVDLVELSRRLTELEISVGGILAARAEDCERFALVQDAWKELASNVQETQACMTEMWSTQKHWCEFARHICATVRERVQDQNGISGEDGNSAFDVWVRHTVNDMLDSRFANLEAQLRDRFALLTSRNDSSELSSVGSAVVGEPPATHLSPAVPSMLSECGSDQGYDYRRKHANDNMANRLVAEDEHRRNTMAQTFANHDEYVCPPKSSQAPTECLSEGPHEFARAESIRSFSTGSFVLSNEARYGGVVSDVEVATLRANHAVGDASHPSASMPFLALHGASAAALEQHVESVEKQVSSLASTKLDNGVWPDEAFKPESKQQERHLPNIQPERRQESHLQDPFGAKMAPALLGKGIEESLKSISETVKKTLGKELPWRRSPSPQRSQPPVDTMHFATTTDGTGGYHQGPSTLCSSTNSCSTKAPLTPSQGGGSSAPVIGGSARTTPQTWNCDSVSGVRRSFSPPRAANRMTSISQNIGFSPGHSQNLVGQQVSQSCQRAQSTASLSPVPSVGTFVPALAQPGWHQALTRLSSSPPRCSSPLVHGVGSPRAPLLHHCIPSRAVSMPAFNLPSAMQTVCGQSVAQLPCSTTSSHWKFPTVVTGATCAAPRLSTPDGITAPVVTAAAPASSPSSIRRSVGRARSGSNSSNAPSSPSEHRSRSITMSPTRTVTMNFPWTHIQLSRPSSPAAATLPIPTAAVAFAPRH